MTHDYKRHGTTTLFAALDVKSGMVIGECLPSHRAREFLRFLRRIDRAVLKPRDVHLVLDNSPPTRRPRSRPGWRSTSASNCTSRRPALPGSTWSNASLPRSRQSVSAGAVTPASTIWKPPSTTTLGSTTQNQSPLPRPKPPKTSSPVNDAHWTNSMKSVGQDSNCQTQNTSAPIKASRWWEKDIVALIENPPFDDLFASPEGSGKSGLIR